MNNVISTWAAYAKNDDVRHSSSSGGIFSILAERTIYHSGVVYGVAMSDDCYTAVYRRIDNIKNLPAIKGSKYLQARVGDTFKYVKKDLEDGIPVLFTGVGCQINGLRGFLGKEYENLLCVDVICHGTPSEKIWQMYLEDFEKKHGKAQSVNFRSKQVGWEDFGMKENSIFISKDADTYMQFFLRNYDLRPSCYHCHAKVLKRSDLTLADFWGINGVAPEMNDGAGISLVLVRTDKGAKTFNNIKEELLVKAVTYEEGVKGNPSEYSSVSRPEQRNTVFVDAQVLSYTDLVKKYKVDKPLTIPVHKRAYHKAKTLIKKILKPGGGTKT